MKSSYRSLELDRILDQVAQEAAFSSSKKAILEANPVFQELHWQRKLQYLKESMAMIQEAGEPIFFFRKDMRQSFLQAKKGGLLNGSQLFDVAQFFGLVQSMIQYHQSIKEAKKETIQDLFSSLIPFLTLEKQLRNTVSPEGEVLDSASASLRNIRSSLARLELSIAHTAQEFVSRHSDKVVDGLITMRGNRTLVLVKASYKNSFGGYVYGDSASGLASYIEPSALVSLNNQRLSLFDQEEEEIARILKEMSALVKQVADQSLANLDSLEEIDQIFAKASWSLKKEACVPLLTREARLYLEKVRHPLIDPKKVVANTYTLEANQHLVLITGPNTGGKTVSLKVIGLSILLSACGIGVLANQAILPMVDEVFVDIGDDQSVVASLSSFSAHMSKQAQILSEVTQNSLVLLDEIGNGTDPKEGEALAISILNHLREVGCMTFATTHYDRLKAYGKRHSDIVLASVLFNSETLLPTYHYCQGLTGSSNAFAVADRYGLPKSIVKYARSLKEQAKSQEDHLIEELDRQRLALDQEKESFQKEREVFLTRYKELHQKEEALRLKEEKFEKEKEQVLQATLRKYEKEAKEIVEALKNKDLKYHEALTLKKQLSIQEEPVETEDKKPFLVGDAVELLSSKQVARIIKVEKKRITIDLNGKSYQVKPSQLRHSLRQLPKKPKESVFVQTGSLFQQSVSSEVNLIGLTVEEAMRQFGDYLDRVKMAHLHQIRIIHGDGSGKLRTAVHKRLDQLEMVDSYRLGMPNEGGTGATVVILKS